MSIYKKLFKKRQTYLFTMFCVASFTIASMQRDKKDQLRLEQLGAAIRKVRQDRSLTMRQVMWNIEQESTVLYRVEKARNNVSFLQLCKICEALDITMSQLMLECELQAGNHIISRK